MSLLDEIADEVADQEKKVTCNHSELMQAAGCEGCTCDAIERAERAEARVADLERTAQCAEDMRDASDARVRELEAQVAACARAGCPTSAETVGIDYLEMRCPKCLARNGDHIVGIDIAVPQCPDQAVMASDSVSETKPLTGAELAAKHGFEPVPDWRKDPFVRPMRHESVSEEELEVDRTPVSAPARANTSRCELCGTQNSLAHQAGCDGRMVPLCPSEASCFDMAVHRNTGCMRETCGFTINTLLPGEGSRSNEARPSGGSRYTYPATPRDPKAMQKALESICALRAGRGSLSVYELEKRLDDACELAHHAVAVPIDYVEPCTDKAEKPDKSNPGWARLWLEVMVGVPISDGACRALEMLCDGERHMGRYEERQRSETAEPGEVSLTEARRTAYEAGRNASIEGAVHGKLLVEEFEGDKVVETHWAGVRAGFEAAAKHCDVEAEEMAEEAGPEATTLRAMARRLRRLATPTGSEDKT